MTLLLLLQYFFVNVFYNPDYGRPVVDRKQTEDSADHYLLCYTVRRHYTNIVVQSQSQCQIAFGRSFTAVSI